MTRDHPNDHLPPEVLSRPDFTAACADRDLGGVLTLAKRWGGPGFTASHLARRCELTVARVQDYVHGRRQARNVDIFARVCDGLRIPGAMFDLAPRPWEEPTPAAASTSSAGEFLVRAHQFVPVAVDVAGVAAAFGATSGQIGWAGCRSAHLDLGDGIEGDLHLFDWGVGVFHIVTEHRGDSIADLALWRRRTHREHRRAVADHLMSTLGETVTADYVLTCFWLVESGWRAADLHTAMHLLCMPRALLGTADHDHDDDLERARAIEQRLFADGFTPGGQVDCGVDGVSIGCASWSGVAYHPIDAHAALAESDLVRCELLAQALWCLCDTISQQVRRGHDPVLPDGVDWRWLRGRRAEMTQAGPTEPSAVRSLRSAVLETSELPAKLTEAIELLKETAA